MKTYLLDTYNRYKRFSETLDVNTKLCNRAWIVFNDGTEREVYKFKEDGTIKIIISGRVTTGTWEYDPSDKTLEIAAGQQAIMVHPGIFEDMLLGLQIDGSNECAFLIEENNVNNFEPKTYSELVAYFQDKEQKKLEEKEVIRLENEKRALEEEKKKQLEEEEKRVSKLKEEHKNKIITSFQDYLENTPSVISAKKKIKILRRTFWVITFILALFIIPGEFFLVGFFWHNIGLFSIENKYLGSLSILIYLGLSSVIITISAEIVKALLSRPIISYIERTYSRILSDKAVEYYELQKFDNKDKAIINRFINYEINSMILENKL